MDDRLLPLGALLRLNGRLFLRALEGVEAEAAGRRPTPETGHLAFIACHLVDARHFLAGYVGAELTNRFAEIFDAAESVEEITDYPTLGELGAEWERVQRAIERRFAVLDRSDLEAPSPRPFPIDDESVLGGIAFLLQHEAYHVGQLGFLRKYLGYEGLTYE